MKKQVTIEIESVSLEGILTLPDEARGIVLFAHGSGSSRLSPRNTYVAEILREAEIGTLLFDLLTAREDLNYERRFDIALLAERLVGATRWLQSQPEGKGRALGYFGASTGAAAALQGAAVVGAAVKAVVSRGGRPDLAFRFLEKVTAPTLLIVGERDHQVLDLNRKAFALLTGKKELSVIPRATHLFEESGTLEQAAHVARDWFKRYLNENAA